MVRRKRDSGGRGVGGWGGKKEVEGGEDVDGEDEVVEEVGEGGGRR